MDKNRFWSKVAKGPGCWEWQTGKFSNGYGQYIHKRAHRVAWELVNGPIPSGTLVLHRCDNRACVKPEHLFLGTQLDNVRDMFNKRRENKARGESHGLSRISKEQALAIRDDQRTHQEIADSYGVSRPLVSMIKGRKRWAHA